MDDRVHIDMSGDEAKLWAAMDKIIQKQADMVAGFGKIKDKAKDTGDEGTAAFDKMAASAAKWVAGLASAGAAVGMIKHAMDQMQEVSDKAAERSRESQRDAATLARATDSSAHTAAGIRLSRQFQIAGNIEKLGAAEQVIGLLSEAKELQAAPLFALGSRYGLIRSPEQMALAELGIKRAMGPRAGSFTEITQKVMAAGKVAETTDLEGIAGGAASAAMQVGANGKTTLDQLLAAVAIMTPALKGDTGAAGKRLQMLLRSAGKSGMFEGKDLLEIAQDVNAKHYDDQTMGQLFPGRGVVSTAKFLGRNADLLKSLAASEAEAPGQHVFEAKAGQLAAIPEIEAAAMARQSAIKKQVAEDQYNVNRNLADSVWDKETTNMQQQYGRFWTAVATPFRWMDWAGRSDEEYIRRRAPGNIGEGRGWLVPELAAPKEWGLLSVNAEGNPNSTVVDAFDDFKETCKSLRTFVGASTQPSVAGRIQGADLNNEEGD